ncbi:MAG: AraC family transcriptional regulator [Candidatus Pacebacteria bacterium]|nr:AraC family transcriptional regulator [Candidatus Paceibacterota bacterium]
MNNTVRCGETEIPRESHVHIEDHPHAGGGHVDGACPEAACAGIGRLTVMRSLEQPGFEGRHCVADTWTIVLTVSGRGEVGSGGNAWPVEADSVYVIPPGVVFSERTLGAEEWHYICLQATVQPGVTWLTLDPDAPFSRPVSSRLTTILQQAVDVLHYRRKGFELTAVGLCLAVFGELVAEPAKAQADRTQLVRKAEHLITSDISYSPTVAELARACRVSVSTLAHAFKAETGYSVHAYILRQRVQKAKGLLLAGLRVGEASDRLGFSNPFHFSRVFRQHEGLSPRQFKQMGGKRVL